MHTTYSGTTLSIARGVPETMDRLGYLGMAFSKGACALKEVPKILRNWTKVSDDLVCQNTTYDVKGGAKWDPVTFKINRIVGDEAQAIYTELEDQADGVGSFKLVLPNGAGILFFTAQVSQFSLADGGNKNTIHTGSVELLLQSDPIVINDAQLTFTNATSLQYTISTVDGLPYSLDFGDGPQIFESSQNYTHVYTSPSSGFAKISFEDRDRIQQITLRNDEWSPYIGEFAEFKNLNYLICSSTGAHGDVGLLSILTAMNIMQFNGTNIHGSLESLATWENISNIWIAGNGVTGDATSLVNSRVIRFRIGTDMTSVQVASTLSALNAAGIENSIIALDYNNGPAPRSSQSDIDELTSRGNTVTTN